MESRQSIEKVRAMDEVDLYQSDDSWTKTVACTDGAKCYPGLCSKRGLRHFVCNRKKNIFVRQVRTHYGVLDIHTGTIDNVWTMLKQALPNSLQTRCPKKFSKSFELNKKLWTYVRSWQWRWENAKHSSLETLTAQTLRSMWEKRSFANM